MIDVIKFPIGVTTEQDFEMIVYAYQSGTTPEQLQMEYGITETTTIKFSARYDKYQFELNIRSDSVIEYTKELRLNIEPAYSASTTGSGVCEKSSGCNSALSIRITDDDRTFQIILTVH